MKRTSTAILLIFILLLGSVSAFAANDFVILPGDDTHDAVVMPEDSDILPEREWAGQPGAQALADKLTYTDLAPGADEAVNAVYYLTTLSVLTGGGAFRPGEAITNSEALAFVYKAFGDPARVREADATVKQTRAQQPGLSSRDEWADGYYLLALQDGLITAEQFDAAFLDTGEDFAKNGAVRRQDAIAWCAMLARLAPAGNTAIIQRYFDHGLMEPRYRPYIEPTVRLGLIHGADRMLLPNQTVTRKQMALILSKFDGYFASKVEKRYGTVRAISADGKTIDVYTDNLRYDRITLSANESFPVFGSGGIGLSSRLKRGDEVCFWSVDGKTVLGMQIVLAADGKKEFMVSDIYRGEVYIYDSHNDQLVMKNLNRYEDGTWIPQNEKPFVNLPVASDAYLYSGQVKISREDINMRLLDHTAYVIVGHYRGGGNDQALYVNIR